MLVAIASLVTAVAPAQAATKTVAYTCLWPQVNYRDATVTFDTGFAQTAPVGTATGETPVDVRIEASGLPDTLIGGAAWLEGTVSATARIKGAGYDETRTFTGSFPRASLPGGGSVRLIGAGTFGSVTLPTAGATSVEFSSLRLAIKSIDGYGGYTRFYRGGETLAAQYDDDEDTFEVPCKPKSGGRDATLVTGTAASSNDTTAPAAPGTPAPTVVTDAAARLAWAPSQDPDVVAYEVSTSYDGLPATTTTVTGTKVRLGGLVRGGTYVVSVRARDAAGNRSAPSSPLSFTTSLAVVSEIGATVPTVGAGNIRDTSFTVGASSVYDIGYEEERYDVMRFSFYVDDVYAGGGRRVEVENLRPNTSYRVKAIAYDPEGNEQWSPEITVRTGMAGGGTAPAPVGYVSTYPGRTSIEAKWYAAKDEDGDPVKYEVSFDGRVVATTGNLSYTFNGLEVGSVHEVSVRVVDPAGNFSKAVTGTDRTGDAYALPAPTRPVLSDAVPSPKRLSYVCDIDPWGWASGPTGIPLDVEYTLVQQGTGPAWSYQASVLPSPQLRELFTANGAAAVQGSLRATETAWRRGGSTRSSAAPMTIDQQPTDDRWTTNPQVSGAFALAEGPGSLTFDTVEMQLGMVDENRDGIPFRFPGQPFDRSVYNLQCRPSADGLDMRVKQYTVSSDRKTVVESTYSPGPTPTPPTPPTPSPTPIPDTDVAPYSYALTGTSALKTLTKGSLPLRGGFEARIGLPSGTVTGNLTLERAAANLIALGFLPVSAKVDMIQTEPVTGSLKGGSLKATAKIRIKLPSVKVLGIELAGGANCQAKQISSVSLASTGTFLPLDGGPIAGTFAISDLTGCGFLNNVVSPLTSGSGNAIAVNLTPR